MSIIDIDGDYAAISIKQEDLEDSISGLSQLKPILQAQIIKNNGANKQQAAIDVKELGKHFDTAIEAMTTLLSGFDDYRKG